MIPDGVTDIGFYAFYGCESLTSIVIPSSVTSICDYAFVDCASIESIVVEQGNAVYHSAGNCLIKTENKTLILGCKNSVIPADDSVTVIGMNAFYNCTGLLKIIIPISVTAIGDYAFYGCASLSRVTSSNKLAIGNNIKSIGNFAFAECNSLTTVRIPESVTKIGKGAFYSCDLLRSVIFYDEYYWYKTKKQDYTDGTSVDVLRAENNAIVFALLSDSDKYYWYKI
jgi:hypothetical protein